MAGNGRAGMLRWLQLNLIGLLLIGLAAAFYLFFFVSRQRVDLRERALRSLAGVADDCEAKLREIDRQLGYVAREGVDETCTTRVSLIQGLTGEEPRDLEQLKATKVGTTSLRVDLTERPAALHFVRRVNETGDAKSAVGARSNLQMILGPLIASHTFDDHREIDEVAIIGGDAEVLHQDRSSVADAQSAPLLNSLAPTLAKGGTTPVHPSQSTSCSEVELGGEPYLLFQQPIRVPLAIVAGAADAASTATSWAAVGLLSRARLERESLLLPSHVLLILVSLVLAGILGAPFLKLWLIDDGERYGIFDAVLLATALLTATGLLTLLFLSTLDYVRWGRALDREAVTVADQVLEHMTGEVDAAAAELRSVLFESCAEAPLRKSRVAVDPSDCAFAAYPFFDTIFWTDSHGVQQQKWSAASANSPSVRVDDRRYFKSALAQTLRPPWFGGGRIPDANACGFEIVQSRSRGKTLACVAIPFRWEGGAARPLAPEDDRSTANVAVLATQLISFTLPVLPLGLEIMVIDEGGNVVLRTEDDHGRRENLLAECSADGRLDAALFARRTEFVNTRYRGDRHRFYVRPMGDQPLFLVVARELNIAATVQFEIVMSSILLLCASVAFFLGCIWALRQLSGGRRSNWFWPDVRRADAYVHAGVVALALGTWLILSARLAAAPHEVLALISVPTGAYWLISRKLLDPQPIRDAGGRPAWIVRLWPHLPWLGLVPPVLLTAWAAPGEWMLWLLVLVAIASVATSGRTLGWSRWLPGSLRLRYTGFLLTLLFLIAEAPAIVIFLDARDHGREGLARMSEIELVRDHEARDERIGRQPTALRQRLRVEDWDVDPGSDPIAEVMGPAAVPAASIGDPTLNLLSRHFSAAVTLWAPALGAVGRAIRRIGVDDHDGSRWHFTSSDRLVSLDDEKTGRSLAGAIPRWGDVVAGGAVVTLVAWALAVVIALLAYRVVLRSAQWLFGLGLHLPPPAKTPDIVPGVVWSASTDRQKRILIGLASGCLVNPRDWDEVAKLHARGLVHKDPALRLGDAMRDLVRGAELPAPPPAEKPAAHRWASVQRPMLLLTVGAAVFFFVTQRDQTSAVVGFLSSLAASIPAVLRMLGVGAGEGKASS